ncbi:hypothetical protein BCV70DRAFT_197326 [Testicularia cyperi]|uniref:Protein ARV n=1 Tax=Testicularia cyperi TaxID=1882483 RepID=A0A317XXV0_9BASI|nr:hypothetical protein BCV70DRAFT_197326 [Testicularia cyperi]
MPVCIHCATPVESLYLRYGRDHIVLSPCRSSLCSGDIGTALGSDDKNAAASGSSVPIPAVLADEYLEHGPAIVILDLILAKPRAYRHLLFNRPGLSLADPVISPSKSATKITEDHVEATWTTELSQLAKRFTALCLVDSYIRWFYLCIQPPVADWATTGTDSQLSTWLSNLSLESGLFFPSRLVPGSHANDGLCSTTSILFPLSSSAEGIASLFSPTQEDMILPTLVSYLNVVVFTFVETLALHLAACLTFYVCTSRVSGLNRPNPAASQINPSSSSSSSSTTTKSAISSFTLPSKAILLSQLSPIILLSFVLLWNSGFPYPHSNTDEHMPASSLASTTSAPVIWSIRTLLASLNAGIAVGTLIPPSSPLPPSSSSSFPKDTPMSNRLKRLLITPLVLAVGWSAQAITSYYLSSALLASKPPTIPHSEL